MAPDRLVPLRGRPRLIHPPEVAGGLVLGTALLGIVVNLVASWLIARGGRTSLNVEGAFQHILNDLSPSSPPPSPASSSCLSAEPPPTPSPSRSSAALMAKAGWELIRESWRIFLEAAPAASTSLQSAPTSTQSTAYPDVHDLHVWEVTSGFPALSAHILVDRSYDCHERQRVITGLPQERYGID